MTRGGSDHSGAEDPMEMLVEEETMVGLVEEMTTVELETPMEESV